MQIPTSPGLAQESVIERLKSYLGDLPNIDMAFLFGSYAKGTQTGRSDIDVAVHFTEEPAAEDGIRLQGELEKLFDKDVDLLILNSAPPILAWTALRGIRLMIRDEVAYIEFMLDVSREAEDFSAFLSDLWDMRRARRAEEEAFARDR